MTETEQLMKLGMSREDAEYIAGTSLLAYDLVKEGMDPITAQVVAGDRRSAARWEAMYESGQVTAEKAINLAGSYGRLDLALRMQEKGAVTEEWLLKELPELWRGSDPDDTDPRFLDLWKRAFARRGYKTICDGKALPRTTWLTIYRGQRLTDPPGIAWTLDRGIAEKFGATFGGRGGPQEGGTVITGKVLRVDAMAYLTGRGESEVVVDPTHVIIE